MLDNLLTTIRLTLKNRNAYLIFFSSALITPMISKDIWGFEGIKLIPTSIGILLGGLLTTIAIIFGVIKDEHIKLLTEKYGEAFIEAIKKLKYHIFLMLIL